MIKTVEQLARDLKVAKASSVGLSALKSVMNVNGVSTFTLITPSRYTKNEKVDTDTAKEFLKLYKGKLGRIGWNKTSTDVYIRIIE
tara:strand:- start:1208 stop:1465 length:258 start_codon:yes stop_codon:yes gene_type:complete